MSNASIRYLMSIKIFPKSPNDNCVGWVGVFGLAFDGEQS